MRTAEDSYNLSLRLAQFILIKMTSTSLGSKSQQLVELDDATIVVLLQPSDADNSSEDGVTPTSNSTRPDPSPDDASGWKATVHIVNFVEGGGFLALPYNLRKEGIAAMLAFLIVPIILWYTVVWNT